jgi:CheY-like chemotaxis protein
MNTLVLDDELRYREHIQHFLERKGLHAITAASIEEARERLRSAPVELIIVDIRLSDMINGLDFADWARQQNRELALIVITGYSSPDYERRSRELGAVAYLEKPFDLKELGLHVQRVQDRRQLLQEMHRLEQKLAAAEEAAPAAQLLTGLPVACISEAGAILFATPSGRAALEAVSDPQQTRPLTDVTPGLLACLKTAENEKHPCWLTLFRRDAILGEYRAMVLRTQWRHEPALLVLLLEGGAAGSASGENLWLDLLARAAGRDS